MTKILRKKINNLTFFEDVDLWLKEIEKQEKKRKK